MSQTTNRSTNGRDTRVMIVRDPQLDAAAQSFVDGLVGAPPISMLTPTQARDVLSGVQAATPGLLPDVSIKDVTLPIGPGGHTDIRVMRPAGATGALPVIVYMHGGGWVMGGKDTHDRLVRELTAGAGAALVFVDYQRSPEAKYPVAIEQGYAVAKHIADNADKLMVDAGRMVIAGDSVGGNMAAVIALLAKERQGPRFRGQLLFYPVTDASMSTDSYDEFAAGPWLTRPAMEWFWDQYVAGGEERDDIHVSPVNATIDDLRDLPQTLLIVDENDVLRDEGEAYGRKLIAAGVPVTSLRYNGTIHDFMMLNPLAATPAVRGAVGQSIGYLRALFAATS